MMDRSDNHLRIYWDPVPGALDYQLGLSADDGMTYQYSVIRIQTSPWSADNDIHYMVTVRARHAGGYYGWSGLSVIWAYTPPAAQPHPYSVLQRRIDSGSTAETKPCSSTGTLCRGPSSTTLSGARTGGQNWIEEHFDATPQTDTALSMEADNALTYTAAVRIRYAGAYSCWSSPATSGPFQLPPTPTPTPVSAPVDVWMDNALTTTCASTGTLCRVPLITNWD